uniref:Endopeptidase Clp n=1 Tax=Dioscorea nipponica TaxID=64700 RepID=A0A0K0N849_9LILI|nr:ATP-dependent Clp protease proteolytic subunit [Dioscorea nipponica]
MPIGVPKVPFRSPGEEDAVWVDVVHTICMGLAASMGSLILVGGEITKRLAFPHAWRHSQGFMYKERAIPYGLSPKTWKGMLLCQQQKPKLMALLIL